MQCVRLFTGNDGRSHFEDLDMSEAGGFVLATHAATGIVFKNNPATQDQDGRPLGDFHNAPRRQYCITMSGSAEIKVGDGTSRTFRAGDVFLAEDVSGQGHKVVPDNWARAFVHLD